MRQPDVRATGEQSGPSSVPRCTLAFRSFVAEETARKCEPLHMFLARPGLSKTTLVPPHPVLPFDIGVPFFISAVLRVSAQFW
jgi:hypothetical protein